MDANTLRLQVSSTNGNNQLCVCAANVFPIGLVKSLLNPLFTCFLSFEHSSTLWTNKTLDFSTQCSLALHKTILQLQSKMFLTSTQTHLVFALFLNQGLH